MPIVTVSQEGQIVLHITLRHAMGLRQGDQLEITLEANRLVLTPVTPAPVQPWQRWRGRLAGTQALQAHMADHADEVRRERLS